MAHGDNRELKPGAPFFRPAKSVSGTRRRVTTEDLEQFRREHLGGEPGLGGPPVPANAVHEDGVARADAPPAPASAVHDASPPALREPQQSLSAIDSPWVSIQPSAPPPASPWVPALDSLPPPVAAPKAPSYRAPRAFAHASEVLRAGILSAVAGYVDAAGFLALFGLLPAHVTGDLIWTEAALGAHADVKWLVRCSMLALFFVAVALTAVAARIIRRRGQSPLASLLALMTLALAVFWAAGVTLRPLMNEPLGLATFFVSGTGIVAMGIENTLMREALGTMCPTTVMTGNMTQVMMELVEVAFTFFDPVARRPDLRRKEALARLGRFGLPVASFSLGALSGAFATNAFGLSSLAVPTLATLVLTTHTFRVARS